MTQPKNRLLTPINFHQPDTAFLQALISMKIHHQFNLLRDSRSMCVENNFPITHDEVSVKDGRILILIASKVEKISYFRQWCHNHRITLEMSKVTPQNVDFFVPFNAGKCRIVRINGDIFLRDELSSSNYVNQVALEFPHSNVCRIQFSPPVVPHLARNCFGISTDILIAFELFLENFFGEEEREEEEEMWTWQLHSNAEEFLRGCCKFLGSGEVN